MSIEIQDNQIKSKERVKDHGEVFTAEREVNAMLDLVADEASRVDSKFLEPACGTGNFLVAILERKLATVEKDHSENQVTLEKYIFTAVGSIYAIDIQEDNCQESRQRMYDIVEEFYNRLADNVDKVFLSAIKQVLELNVILGNGLTGLQVDEDNMEGYEDQPIVFSEWSFEDDVIIRKDFGMNDMITHEKRKAQNKEIMSDGLFGMIENNKKEEELMPIIEYKYNNYMEVI